MQVTDQMIERLMTQSNVDKAGLCVGTYLEMIRDLKSGEITVEDFKEKTGIDVERLDA